MELAGEQRFIGFDYKVVKITVISIFTVLLLVSIYFFSTDNLLVGLACPLLPIPFYLLYIIFKYPRIGFITSLLHYYSASLITRLTGN